MVKATPNDFSPPDIIQNITAINHYKKVDLSWNASTDVNFKSYLLYKNDIQLIETVETFYTDTQIENGEIYIYNIVVLDIYDNKSGKSNNIEGQSIIDKIPIIDIEKINYNELDIVITKFNDLDEGQSKVFYNLYYKKIQDINYNKNIYDRNTFKLILESENDYNIYVEYQIDNISSEKSDIINVSVGKEQTLYENIKKVKNLSYDLSNNNIILSWEINSFWDLKEYYITVKKGFGIDSISNLQEYIVSKDSSNFVVENYEFDTDYEIKIYSKTVANELGLPSIINFKTMVDPNLNLNISNKAFIDELYQKKNIYLRRNRINNICD